MYKIKDEIINEVCERLSTIAKLSLEVGELLESGKINEGKGAVDYDPDEYMLRHLQIKTELNGGVGK